MALKSAENVYKVDAMKNITPKQKKLLMWTAIVIWGLFILKDYLPL